MYSTVRPSRSTFVVTVPLWSVTVDASGSPLTAWLVVTTRSPAAEFAGNFIETIRPRS
ncbi:hypothetical protein ACIRG5_15875 [Lentzea sp. NPDC102401]|uniref:hypothetical protein n=1 Tax=Lentzea sp. NPDC102401 TaxID=3364128 RepID=UPI0038119BA7